MGRPSDSERPRHGIGVVVRRTGLLADRIRAWERRHGVVAPARTATGRRLYTDTEVRRLQLLRRAVEGGHGIGSVAHLDDGRLLELIAGDGAAGGGDRTSPEAPGAAGGNSNGDGAPTAGAIVDAALGAVRALDRKGLEAELTQAVTRLPLAEVLERIVAPLMARVGELWREGLLRPVQEHLASAVLRSFVGSLMQSGRVPAGAPRVVVSTPRRQRHEMGGLVVAASAAAAGWQVLYLGPDVGAKDLATAVRVSEARALALSVTYPPDDAVVSKELLALGRMLPAGVALWVGGQGAGAYGGAIERSGATMIEGLPELRRRLDELGAQETAKPPRQSGTAVSQGGRE